MEIDKLEYYIGQRLLQLTDINVYNKKPPQTQDNIFPYLVFNIHSCVYNVRNRKDWVLEIDFWIDSNDNTEIIEASINVKNGTESIPGLNKSTQNETEGFYYSEIDFEDNIPDVEPNISRYNQRYILKVD